MSLDLITQWVDQAIDQTPVLDLHTHLYPPSFGAFNLWGVDELLTYHYLIAETIRASDVSYDKYWSMNQQQQADLIWKTLFLERAPVSEACRGVLTTLGKLGLDLSSRDLNSYRVFFKSQKAEAYLETVLKTANVRQIVMTNDALDPKEREIWLSGKPIDPRFKGVLRIDPVLLGWPKVSETLSSFGYKTSGDLGATTMTEVRRFLNEWIDRMKAIYVACSLTPDWRYPDDSPTTRVINEAILPVCRERNIPFAVMIGVRRQVNPRLRLAGDAVGKSDIASLDRLCAMNPKNKFMVTMLSRENQHELAVSARKHRNLFLFGCWWFLNNPSLIEEMTKMRMELLGTSFTPQHSDARVLDQLIYKWDHSRKVIAKVMKQKFSDLAQTGWKVTREEVDRTAREYLGANFESFLARTMS
jgi:hypothetical protein